jgi:hypothetical protein
MSESGMDLDKMTCQEIEALLRLLADIEREELALLICFFSASRIQHFPPKPAFYHQLPKEHFQVSA